MTINHFAERLLTFCYVNIWHTYLAKKYVTAHRGNIGSFWNPSVGKTRIAGAANTAGGPVGGRIYCIPNQTFAK